MGPGVCRAALYHRVRSRHARLGERTALEAHTQTRACAIFRDLVQPDRTVARARAVCLPAGAQCIELRSKGRMSKNGECPALPVNPLPQPRAVKGRRRIELLMQPDQISAQRLCQGQEQRAQLRGMISVKWFERLDQRV